jgi:hypothetical protein
MTLNGHLTAHRRVTTRLGHTETYLNDGEKSSLTLGLSLRFGTTVATNDVYLERRGRLP